MPDAVALAMVEALPATAPTVGWQTIGNLGGVATSAAAVSADGARIYVSHGYFGNSVRANLQVMDAATGSYVIATNSASVARQGVAGAWCNGKHYAIGGITSANAGSNVVEAYTPAGSNGASGVWSTMAVVPSSRGYMSAAVIGNFIYAAGGQINSNVNSAGSFFARYDTTNNTWTTLVSMPDVRTQGAMVAVGSKLYYLGGANSGGSPTTTVYVFDTTAGTWSTSGMPLPTAVLPANAAVIGDRIYHYGSTSQSVYIGSSWAPGDTSWGSFPVTTYSAHGDFFGMVALGASLYLVSGTQSANVDKLDLGAGIGYTSAVLGAKSLLNPLLAGVAATLPNTPPTVTADRNAYAQTVQTLKALTYIS